MLSNSIYIIEINGIKHHLDKMLCIRVRYCYCPRKCILHKIINCITLERRLIPTTENKQVYLYNGTIKFMENCLTVLSNTRVNSLTKR